MKSADFLSINRVGSPWVISCSVLFIQVDDFYFEFPSITDPTRCHSLSVMNCFIRGWTLSHALQLLDYSKRLRYWLNYSSARYRLWKIIMRFTLIRTRNCQAHLFRWVQGAGTYSPDSDKIRLLRIPASRGWVATLDLN